MKRQIPKECPHCQSTQFSYESSEITIETHRENNRLAVCDDSEWTCLECDNLFWYRAWYELGNLIDESVTT